MPDPLKLRDDLITSRQETPEGSMFVVKDPTTRRFFRFREPEYRILRQLDGRTPLGEVREKLEREFAAAISEESLHQFVEHLRRLGLLETDQPRSSGHSPLGQRIAGNPLYIRLKAFDPDRLFTRLLPKVWFFFTPWFVGLSLVIFCTALVITIGWWDEIVRDFGRLYRFDALLLAWATVLLVTTAHEFAHGLTCKRFGGEVHEIGFLLLYFQPAFYCNISDAWLFPEKWKRLWVTFAGAYFEMFVWSVATLVWWVTETDNWVNFLAMIVMATSGIKTFFNMNPLIKLDGYYLLSDYLEIPNLRQRSVAYLKNVIRRLWGSAAAPSSATLRERRIYTIYGLLAVTYSWWLLSLIAMAFGSYLVERYQGHGFIAFSGLLMVAFKNPLGRAARTVPAALWQKPLQMAHVNRPTVRLTLLILLLAIVVLGRLELKVSGEFTVLPERNADVRAAVEGTIEEVLVIEGERVEAGDVVIRLSQRDYRAGLEKVEAEIAEKRATLRMLRAGPRSEEIAVARDEIQTATTKHEHARRRFEEAERMRAARLSKAEAAVTAARERLEHVRIDLGRSTELFESGLVSRKQLDDSKQDVAVREKELEVAEAELLIVSSEDLAGIRQDLAVTETEAEEAGGRLTLLRAGSRPEEIEAIEAAAARLEAEQRYLTEQLRLTAVVSPAAGIVATPKLKERVGEYVKKGDLLLKVYEFERITEMTVSEKEIADVRTGQQVLLKARAYPEKLFSGTVKAVAPVAIDDPDLKRKVFRVMVNLDDPSGLLKPEMTGNAKIVSDSRPIFELLTRRIARYVRVEFWSWW